jgi:beta-barrel assembly-enhancing protease
VISGKLYDGHSGHPHEVAAEFHDGRLTLATDDGWSETVEADRLIHLEGTKGTIRLGIADSPGWRLVLPSEAAEAVEQWLGSPNRYGRWIDRIGLIPALLAGGAMTGAVLVTGYFAPHLLAPHVPMSWERNVGSAIVGDFGDLRCRNGDGQRALEALVERVAPGSTKGKDAIKVAALDVPAFNAAALPGGYIVVFKPAITESDPDALAGIMAHEVAHVKRRHVTEALLRELGIGALIRLFAGNIGANAEQIVSLSYTRSNETQADADAIAMLKRANVSPKPTADLFQHLSDEQKEGSGFGAEFLQSHPLSMNRAQKFAAAFDAKRQYRPALTRDESDALFNICWKGPVKDS